MKYFTPERYLRCKTSPATPRWMLLMPNGTVWPMSTAPITMRLPACFRPIFSSFRKDTIYTTLKFSTWDRKVTGFSWLCAWTHRLSRFFS